MPAKGPLDGITVIDLTRVLAGPYCTMLLADMGARVIKVEVPEKGDDARAFGPFLNGKSGYFMSLNRGKESIALNLKSDSDREIFEKLLEKADVLVENFRPGTMEKLGYGWEALKNRFPALVYAAASGFGHSGPYKARPSYDMVAQAMGGLMSLTGEPGGPPARVGSSMGDITAGMFTAIGVCSALYHKATTGKGLKVDVSMLDSQVAILENAIVRYTNLGEIPGRQGARHPTITPFASYATKDGHIVIAAGNDAIFRKLCHAIDRSDLADNPLFLTNDKRTEHYKALTDELETALSGGTSEEWLRILEIADVPCGPINNVKQVVENPQVKARNMVVYSDDDKAGRVYMAGNPIKISGFADPVSRRAAPDLDGDRRKIIAEL
ncbi:MAG: CoA transferase [Rhodospirillales bacterium]|nr:CoA transferase [Rhodospirillales bacterium]MCW8952256.1 CoA transferase [Rhodospirillales bacterium]MCW8970175.1 CoA transferase [Rhodospirillales bacterium]MCW9001918.1 CoA transferase [Rhodospirillales bacterium]